QDDDRLAVEPDLLGVPFGVVLDERPRGAEAGAVDEKINIRTEISDLGLERGGVGCKIALHRSRGGREVPGERLEAVRPARDQEELVAALCELAGELLTD